MAAFARMLSKVHGVAKFLDRVVQDGLK